MQKEILNNERIKQNIKYIYATKQDLGYSLFPGVSSILFFVLTSLILLFSTIKLPMDRFVFKTFNLTFSIVCLLGSVSIIFTAIKSYKVYFSVKKGKFSVKNETLVNTREGTPYHNGRYTTTQFLRGIKPYLLQFEKSGKFEIPKIEKYPPDNKFINSYKEMFSTSEIGDTYYLIVLNKKIVYAYNQKFFDYINN